MPQQAPNTANETTVEAVPEAEKLDRIYEKMQVELNPGLVHSQLTRMVGAMAIEKPANWARPIPDHDVAIRACNKLKDLCYLRKCWAAVVHQRGRYLGTGAPEMAMLMSMAILQVLKEELIQNVQPTE